MGLNKVEEDIAKEIINIGLGKAADSMAFFTQDKVFIRTKDLRICKTGDIKHINHEGGSTDERFVLTTNVKGELEGACYLIFTAEEVEKLLNKSLPSSVLEDEAKKNVMGDAILLELDNIISASVITQFSNFFKYKMYGDVPGLDKVQKDDVNDLLLKDAGDYKSFIYFHSEFSTGEMDINPEFIWFLDAPFFTGVQAVMKDDQMMEKIESSI